MRNKRLLSFLLVMVMVLASFLSSSGLALAAEMEGEGTELSPYLIKTPKDLYDIKDSISAYYKLANDLDFENIQRQPIDEFKGVLDGGGHVIKNVNIVGTGKVGLFGTLTGVTIKDLGIETATITASGDYAGVLFGTATNSTFTNFYIKKGTVNGVTSIGGIGGFITNCVIEGCYTLEGKVKGTGGNVGGLFGYSSGGAINKSFYTGEVIGAGSVGGIVAYVYSTTPINDSYSIGTVTSNGSYACGIIGSGSVKINNCYSSMLISGSQKGGLSYNFTTENTKNSYFDSTVSELTTPNYQVRTTEQLYQKSNYVDWDFENTWTIEEGKSYPTLRFAQDNDTTNQGESGNSANANFKMVLEIGEQLQLSLNDSLIVNEEATWTSSNENILTVDNKGMVKALEVGSVVITVNYYEEDYTEKIHILVVLDATYLRLAVDLKVGEKALATIDDLKYTEAVTWSSDNPKVATISKRGKIIARGQGLALVIATDKEGKEIGQVYVRVR